MPYQIAQNADLTIRIYDVSGRLIRQLNLGNKIAGYYLDKQKAAYWDGKNDIGELVASGTYFYSIQAGNFSETKKLLILK